jgi:pimeloyl-ACP methyl ester carboxylesterase
VRRFTPLAASLLIALACVSCAKESDKASAGFANDSSDNSGKGSSDSETGNQQSSGNGNGNGDGTGTIDWSDCGGNSQCASVKVPVDYEKPDGPTMTLSVARVPASGERIGSLFVNPGGPGATATDFAATMATVLPSDLTEHFDIVGVDPRGTGESAIDCGGDFVKLYGVDYSIDSPDDKTKLLDVSHDYVDGCEKKVGDDLLPHLGTRDAARDIDTVRQKMGDDKLSYLGFSYGTAIGQEYAQMFPEHVRAMVIDGVLELGPSGIQTAHDQALGFETALNSFVDNCNGDESCPIGPDAMSKIEQLIAKVERAPISASPRDLGPGELNVGMGMALYSQSLWPDLADGVESALQGDGSGMVSLADQYLGIGNFDVYFAVDCLDFDWPHDPNALLQAGADTAKDAPHFGEYIVNDYVRCAMWPVKPEPLTAVDAPNTPPILVVSTTNDPATPYEAGVRVAHRLKSGVLLTYEGDGHTVVGNGVPCVDDIVVKYLIDLDPPKDGTTC